MPLTERAPTPAGPDDPAWLTATRTGRMLDVAPKTIRRRCADGTLPFTFVKVGSTWRILRADVEAATKAGTNALLDGRP